MDHERRRARVIAALSLVVLFASHPSFQVDFILTQAVYQVSMLLQRRAVDRVAEGRLLDEARLRRLALASEVRQYAIEQIGPTPAGSYRSVAVGFERTMYNVTACEADRFEAYGRWFPIVGSLPYTGFFRQADTHREEARLRRAGYDVSVRVVGAYSTLGWFDDPILPAMLDWPEYRLADTLIHESAHATLFLPGQMRFNESYARFVGNSGAERFMQTRRVVADEQVAAAEAYWHDRDLQRDHLHALYLELDQLYQQGLPRDETLRRKQIIISTAAARCAELDFIQDRYRSTFDNREINNAALLSFRTYNSGEEQFAAVLQDCNGDLRCFVDELQEIDRGGHDGWEWLARRTGLEIEGVGRDDRPRP
jgi:predicted aminopeptidase